jgi:hydrogenase nickel incorporation protein HypB
MFKVIRVEETLFEENKKIAEEVKEILNKRRIISFNVMGAPGSGKTLFIERTIETLRNEYKFGVIEGDIEGDFDAEKFRKFDIPVIQINTGGACHLDANMVKNGILNLPVEKIDILFIENVGNLVCPAEFEIGNDINIVVSSITEGENKVLKYPLMFKVSHICILNKIDLLPYIEFDFEKFKKDIEKISPETYLIKLSSKSGENFNEWIEYLRKLKREKRE